MVKFDHHVGSRGLRFLFHSAAGSRFGTGPPRHRSAHAFGFVSRIIASSRLFGAAASPRPLSGLPAVRAGVRGVSSSRLLESHARPGPFSARPSSKSRTNGSRRYSGFASSNSSGARPRLPRQRLQRPQITPRRLTATTAAWPATRWAQSETPRLFHLPAVVEDKVLPPDQCHCSRCGQPFADFPGTEDSPILEIDVRAHRRVIRRRRYRPTCSCGAHPGIVTAPPPDRLIPKSMLGISLLVTVLLDKYLFYRPTYRLLADWPSHGLDLRWAP